MIAERKHHQLRSILFEQFFAGIKIEGIAAASFNRRNAQYYHHFVVFGSDLIDQVPVSIMEVRCLEPCYDYACCFHFALFIRKFKQEIGICKFILR